MSSFDPKPTRFDLDHQHRLIIDDRQEIDFVLLLWNP
jgi:hypothetical protein